MSDLIRSHPGFRTAGKMGVGRTVGQNRRGDVAATLLAGFCGGAVKFYLHGL